MVYLQSQLQEIFMTIREFYEKIGADYNDALSRLISENLVSRFVRKFPADPTMQSLRDSIAEGKIEESFRAVHTLKGVAGNLAFTRLYQACWDLTEQLRPREQQADPVLMEVLEKEYEKTVRLIEELQ